MCDNDNLKNILLYIYTLINTQKDISAKYVRQRRTYTDVMHNYNNN